TRWPRDWSSDECSSDLDDGAGKAFGDSWPEEDDCQRCCGDRYGLPSHGACIVEQYFDAREEFTGDWRSGEAEKVFDLRGCDQEQIGRASCRERVGVGVG